MQHHPIETHVWRKKVGMAELPLTTKAVAMFLAHFANEDGSRVRPGERILAAITGLTERAVRMHLAALREVGLIERVEHGKSRGRADVYQLTLPGGAVDTVPMRLDKDWDRLEPAAPPRRRRTATGTPVPVGNPVDEAVDNTEDRNPGSGSDDSPVQGYRNDGAALPETGSASTGTPVPPTNQTTHHQPIPGLPQVGTSLVAAGANGHGEEDLGGGFEPSAEEYAAAYEILIVLPDIDQLNTVAIAELHAVGVTHPSATQIAVRAADIATRPAVPDEQQAPGSVPGARREEDDATNVCR